MEYYYMDYLVVVNKYNKSNIRYNSRNAVVIPLNKVKTLGNLENIFRDFGKEVVTTSSHLEKLCLIKEGVGRDSISDFTTNLIKYYLLNYTQDFAVENINKEKLREITVRKVKFNYTTEVWEDRKYLLPYIDGDYIILTPRDILTKDDIWINKTDLFDHFEDIPYAIQMNNFAHS